MAKFIKDEPLYTDPNSYLLNLAEKVANKRTPYSEDPIEKAGEVLNKTEETNKKNLPVETVNGMPIDREDINAEIEEIDRITSEAKKNADIEKRQYTTPDLKELENMSIVALRKLKNRLHQAEIDLDTGKKQLLKAEQYKEGEEKDLAIQQAKEKIKNAWMRLQVRFINTDPSQKTQAVKRTERMLENLNINSKKPQDIGNEYGRYWVERLNKYLRKNLPDEPIFDVEMANRNRMGNRGNAYQIDKEGTPSVGLTGYVSPEVTEEDIKSCVESFAQMYPETGAKYISGKPKERQVDGYNDWIIYVEFTGDDFKYMPYYSNGNDVYEAYKKEYNLNPYFKNETVDSKKEIPYARFNDAFGENPLKNLRTNMLEMPNGEVVYVEYLNGQLIAGPATNAGIIPLVTIDYDEDMTVDGNIEAVYDELIENLDWDYNPETGRYDDSKKSCKDADEWRFKLAKRRNSYDEYVIRAYKNGKYDEEATYYTDDWDDAVGTLTDIAQRQGLKVREEKSGFVAE